MKEISVFHEKFTAYEKEVKQILNNFTKKGNLISGGERNTLKTFLLSNDIRINVKAFKVPNLINQVAYKHFRKSKAQRSFEYANILQERNIGTPQPIAYIEYPSAFLFKKSFYICEHLEADYTYRDLTKDFDIPNYEEILRAFTRFTYKLHENQVLFLDHSPGNTLIKKEQNAYSFYLVDLNRMQFKNLSFEERIKNFSRLTIHKKMVEIMSHEYAKCINEPYQKVFDLMWQETEAFQEKYHRKRRLKKKIKFWKK
ncbi:lipopolysaccharide kinase InaA family protein [Haloflavibacter putidus]|uniref:Kdo domain containing protein n=1 Tax=Haloflavibacter putidus TaxID=2576776 RepID=A0A507ZRU3_9FLAO|nr:lipopolysaccharide kinase InaA family protein [Haloflavibacter putidus]TQD40099.1 Kdo domain containing protein [Haloflavibacter putidus]